MSAFAQEMNSKMALLSENDNTMNMVYFGKWLYKLKMIIGFPKPVTSVCKLPFSVSNINTDTNRQVESSQLLYMLLKWQTWCNIFFLNIPSTGEHRKGRRQYKMMGEGSWALRWGGTTNHFQQSQLERWFHGRTVRVMKYIKRLLNLWTVSVYDGVVGQGGYLRLLNILCTEQELINYCSVASHSVNRTSFASVILQCILFLLFSSEITVLKS